jgi:hypothetical protein
MYNFSFFMSDLGQDATYLCCICDPNYLDNLYEECALDLGETSRAFCCTVEKKLAAIAVVDFKEKHSVELVLLCKNHKFDIRSAPYMLLMYIESYLSEIDVHKIHLKVARENINKHAVKFYTRNGFRKLNNYWVKNIKELD